MQELQRLHSLGTSHSQNIQNNQNSDKNNNEEQIKNIKASLEKYAQEILDKERLSELNKLMKDFPSESEKLHDIFLNIIKYFVLSPVEKNYIQKIQEDLVETVCGK